MAKPAPKGRKPGKATKAAKPKASPARKPAPKAAPKSRGSKPASKQPFAELPPSLDIRNIGRPSKYDPSYCDLVLDLGAEGKSRAQIAASLGVSRDTIHEWSRVHREFSDALRKAKDLELAWWESAGQMNMTRQGFNATAFIFQMKNRFRDDYRDVIANEHTGKDGGPIEMRRSAKDLTDDELAVIASGSGPRAAAP